MTERDPFDREALADLLNAVAAQQDKAAFAVLFEHFAPRIKAYLMRLGCDAAQGEELMQDVMLTVWRKAALFDRRQAAPSTWIFTIARNRRIDILRRERFPEIDPADPMLVPDDPVQPDDEVDRFQQEARLRAAMRSLPEGQLELLHHAFFKGKSHRELAEDFDLPLGTVKSRMRLAFARLRKALGEDEEAARD